MTTSDKTDIISAGIAGAALLLSVFIFYIGRRDRQLRPRVWISKGTHTVRDKIHATESSMSVLYIESTNRSDRRIVITYADVFIRKRDFALEAPNFKTDEQQSELMSGDNAIFMLPLSSLATSLREQKITGKVKLQARVHDTLHNSYYSSNSIVLIADDLL
jgi:hypothetical protein